MEISDISEKNIDMLIKLRRKLSDQRELMRNDLMDMNLAVETLDIILENVKEK